VDYHHLRKKQGRQQLTLFSLEVIDELGKLREACVECCDSEVSLVDAKILNAECYYRRTEAVKPDEDRVIDCLDMDLPSGK
jgi:hypothetical protein